MFMIPFGLCTAVRYMRFRVYFPLCDILFTLAYSFLRFLYMYSTRVSNELGAGQPQAAKMAARVVMFIALSSGLLIASTMILLRGFWGYMYSNEPEVVKYIAKMIPVLGISFFTDGLHGSLSGKLYFITEYRTPLSKFHTK